MVNWGDVPTWCLVGLAAIGGAAALWQLQLQRIQLGEQQKVIERQTRLQEREQADQIDMAPGSLSGALATVLPPESGELAHTVVVTNGSKRPVREVAAKIVAIGTDRSVRFEKLADVYGNLVRGPETPGQPGSSPAQFNLRARASTMPVLRVERSAAFVWGFPVSEFPEIIPTIRFTDDAGLHWEIGVDLHLEKLPTRDW
jgi:hypothetical protein